ncbi:MAG: hypothetical protein IPP71_13040 [Bacteroidetes bacterium]|nr:hypothetical protein [Bacteroidota bacterium]
MKQDIVDLNVPQLAAVASLASFSTTNLRPVVDALSWADNAPVMRVASTGDNAQASAGVFTTTNFSGGADAVYAENFTSTTRNGHRCCRNYRCKFKWSFGVRGFAIGYWFRNLWEQSFGEWRFRF